MPYFCSRIQCGYFWDKRGRSNKKTRCPQCHTMKVIYIRHGKVEDIKNFIARRKKWIQEQEEKISKAPEPEPSSLPQFPKGRRKKELTSGMIEYFHRRYRQWKEQRQLEREYNPGLPYQDPLPHLVRDWILSTNEVSKSVAERWAIELLEKYIPKENQKTE